MAKQLQTIQREQLGEIKNLITSAAQARYHFTERQLTALGRKADAILMGATALLVAWPVVLQGDIDGLDSRDRELWDKITDIEEEAGAV